MYTFDILAILFCVNAVPDVIMLIIILLTSGDVLEIGAQWAIGKKDIAAFERYMAQLKTYYFDYK